MSSLVLELQREALDKNADVTSLLRKARVIAHKLKIAELETWAANELNGYDGNSPIPDYREHSCEVKARNPYHGLIPVMWPGDAPEWFNNCRSGQSVAEIESMLQRDDKDAVFIVPFTDSMTAALMRGMGGGTGMPPFRVVQRSSLVGIVERVRTLILDWTLKLEEEGILGKDMTFTAPEIQNAQTHRDIIISNFQGILGPVTHSTVTQNLSNNVHQGDFASLSQALRSHGATNDDASALKKAIDKDPPLLVAGKFGAEVSQWMGKMLQKAASGAWEISLVAAGNLLSEAINRYYGLR
jgi:AbiTii